MYSKLKHFFLKGRERQDSESKHNSKVSESSWNSWGSQGPFPKLEKQSQFLKKGNFPVKVPEQSWNELQDIVPMSHHFCWGGLAMVLLPWTVTYFICSTCLAIFCFGCESELISALPCFPSSILSSILPSFSLKKTYYSCLDIYLFSFISPFPLPSFPLKEASFVFIFGENICMCFFEIINCMLMLLLT